MTGRRAASWAADAGATLVELLVAATLVVSVAGIAVPLTAQAADAARIRAAASHLAGRLRLTQLRARHRATALVFDRVGSAWTFRLCEDGNGNGVRRADIAAAADVCWAAAERIVGQFPGVSFELGTGVPDVDGDVVVANDAQRR